MVRNEKPEEQEKGCFCPYCEGEVAVATGPFCQPCGMTLRYCAACQIAVDREVEVCPQCGGSVEWK